MNALAGLEQCLAFIYCQLQSAKPVPPAHNGSGWGAVTISRQAGSGGDLVARTLAEYLEGRSPGRPARWLVFDRNLVQKVLEDRHLPARLARFIPEDRISEMEDTLDRLFGLHPPSWMLVRKTAQTILHLAELGNVILIGRGANIVTSKLDHVFHVRLVGSLERRCEFVQQSRQLGRKAALAIICDEDRGRRQYVKKYFGKDIDDPLLYHAVIDTDLVGHQRAAQMIADALLPVPRQPPAPLRFQLSQLGARVSGKTEGRPADSRLTSGCHKARENFPSPPRMGRGSG
jgi:cytidylate kinase